MKNNVEEEPRVETRGLEVLSVAATQEKEATQEKPAALIFRDFGGGNFQASGF